MKYRAFFPWADVCSVAFIRGYPVETKFSDDEYEEMKNALVYWESTIPSVVGRRK